MILLDGIQYEVKTPEENVTDMCDTINTWCATNDVRNTHGDVIQIEKNFANPLYIMLYGLAYLVTILQKLIYSAGCSVSIASSADKQLLNIADMCGIKRRERTKTSVTCIVYSNLSGTGAVTCHITTDLSVTIPVSGVNVVFHPAYDIDVPPDESRTIVLIAETYGSYSISAGSISSFDSEPEGFRAMTSLASVPGQDQESIADLRQRIQRRSVGGTKQDLASEAIGQLDGVSVCNIYFNNSVAATETVMGIQVPPRHSLLFVQGYSPNIAKTYWSYMTTRCAGSDHAEAVEQVYNTRAGQALPVYIFAPEIIPVFIRLYFNQAVEDVTAQAMRDTIATLAASLSIGQRLTSTEVVDVLQAKFSVVPAGCQLSLSDTNYGYQVKPGSYQLLSFIVDVTHIQIINSEA